MIGSAIVILFVVGAAFIWSTQGLFSALLHLAMTLVAATLAFAVWEPLVFGYLIDRMPEYSWGVGLIAPFVIFLFIFRIAADKLVPGNVDQAYLVNTIGGGAVGAVSGLITAGVVVIGLQLLGGLNLGYQPWRVVGGGEIKRQQSLILPADRIVARWFTALSAGSLRPSFGSVSLASHHPDLAQEAGLYGAVARANARQSIAPDAVEIDRMITIGVNRAPKPIGVLGDDRALVLGLKLDLTKAADGDSVFTASRGQVALISETATGKTHAIFPAGWVYRTRGVFGTFGGPDDYIRTKPVQEDAIELVFIVPEKDTPRFLRIKGVRFDLPEEQTMTADQVDAWIAETRWEPTEAPDGDTGTPDNGPSGDLGDPTSVGAGVEGVTIDVSDALPFVYSYNTIMASCSDARFNESDPKDRRLVRANGVFQRDGKRVQDTLAVQKIDHAPGQAVVRVRVEHAAAKSTLAKAIQAAAAVAGPPLLVDNEGSSYRSIGYVIETSGQVRLAIDPANPIRALEQTGMNKMSGASVMYLYFVVARGVTITEFSFSSAVGKQTTNLKID